MMRTILVFVALSAVLAAGQAPASDPPSFVDLDGDGFNDNDPDVDGNGIPDQFERGYVPPVDEKESAGIFANLQAPPPTVEGPMLFETNKDAFGRRSFLTRNMCDNRCAFDADFGSGLGIAVAAGGACAGGVCF